jgi:hypothetical protein
MTGPEEPDRKSLLPLSVSLRHDAERLTPPLRAVDLRIDFVALSAVLTAFCRAAFIMKFFRQLLGLFAVVACAHVDAQTTSASHDSISESNAAVFKACAAAPAANGACPLHAVFGLFKPAPNSDAFDFKTSNTVPLVVNQKYGWILKLNQMTGKVRVLERMTLPQAPKTWGTGGQPYGTSADRKTMSLDVTLTIHNGIVSNSWDVVSGDPPGHYLISAFVENSPPVQFEFDVIDPR